MNIVRARDFNGWNMSVSMIFGKSPKLDIQCGKCGKWFSRRFDLEEFPDPVTKCDYCRTVNMIPIKYS